DAECPDSLSATGSAWRPGLLADRPRPPMSAEPTDSRRFLATSPTFPLPSSPCEVYRSILLYTTPPAKGCPYVSDTPARNARIPGTPGHRRQLHRHDGGVVRLLPLRDGFGARIQQTVLPGVLRRRGH